MSCTKVSICLTVSLLLMLNTYGQSSRPSVKWIDPNRVAHRYDHKQRQWIVDQPPNHPIQPSNFYALRSSEDDGSDQRERRQISSFWYNPSRG